MIEAPEFGRILVIEDDQGIINVYKRILGSIYEIDFTKYKKQALGLLEEYPFYDFVLVDLNLIDGNMLEISDDDEWTKYFLKIPFLVVSANDSLGQIEECCNN